jgi:hypothetical protein
MGGLTFRIHGGHEELVGREICNSTAGSQTLSDEAHNRVFHLNRLNGRGINLSREPKLKHHFPRRPEVFGHCHGESCRGVGGAIPKAAHDRTLRQSDFGGRRLGQLGEARK